MFYLQTPHRSPFLQHHQENCSPAGVNTHERSPKPPRSDKKLHIGLRNFWPQNKLTFHLSAMLLLKPCHAISHHRCRFPRHLKIATVADRVGVLRVKCCMPSPAGLDRPKQKHSWKSCPWKVHNGVGATVPLLPNAGSTTSHRMRCCMEGTRADARPAGHKPSAPNPRTAPMGVLP